MTNNTKLQEHFPNIVLASKSPRRADLLRQIKLEFEVRPSKVDEPNIIHTSPEVAVQKLAHTKAKTIATTLNKGLVIGADTVVVMNQQAIGKPENEDNAIEILTQLSGNRHKVITAVAIIDLDRGRNIMWQEKTIVYFRTVCRSEILEYVRSGEAADKAGAYGIQGSAAAFIKRIEGCYSNVVGLPLGSLVEHLWGLLDESAVSI
jgi:septum formation protein